MKQKVAAFLNSPYLGGAERSLIYQLSSQTEFDVTFYVPYFKKKHEAKEIDVLIRSCCDFEIVHYRYPQTLFSFSRSARFSFFKIIFSLVELVYLSLTLNILRLKKYNVLWVNGNKVFLPVCFCLLLFGYKSFFVWHLRDYPVEKGLYKILSYLFNKIDKKRRIVISNSNDVGIIAKSILGNEECTLFQTLYNPVGNLEVLSEVNELKIIGIVSMLAPWKGIHEILEFEKRYRDQLVEIGIESIKIYGSDIYKTSGSHSDYYEKLLLDHEENSLVSFEGKRDPQHIFNEIDVLIHPSIDKEPFGRVIIESFRAQRPVLSRALGGSGELVISEKTGIIYSNYDELINGLRKLTDVNCRKEMTDRALAHLENIENDQKKFWENLRLALETRSM